MCSSTVSDTANRLRKTRKKKSSAVPLFRSGHMSAICARLGSKGKVGVQRGRETAGVPSFLPPPRGAARSRRPQTANPHAEIQRKTSRPSGANTPAAVRAPHWVGAEKVPPVRGANPLTQFAHPAQPVQEKEPPRQGEPADAVRAPHWVGAEKEPPRQGEHADAVRAPRSAGAGKGAARQGEHACGSSRTPLSRCSEKECRTRTLVHL